MCTLCLSDMGELRDEWLREPPPPALLASPARIPDAPAPAPSGRVQAAAVADDQAVAA